MPIVPFALFSPRPNIQDQFVFDGTLTGTFELLSHRFEAAVGGDYQHFKGDIPLGAVLGFEPSVNNVFAYTPAAYPRPPSSTPAIFRSQLTTNQSGVFASVRVYLNDVLSLVSGARVSSNRLTNALSLELCRPCFRLHGR